VDSGSADVTDVLNVDDGPGPPDHDEGTPAGGYGAFLAVAALVLVADQLTKWWAVEALEDGRTIDLFWTLRFNLVRNEGAAFSFGEGITPLISLLAIALSITLLVVARHVESRAVRLSMGLVLGGALGNVVDRIARSDDGFLRGAVVDFIDLQWYPVFNIADMGVVIGGVLIVVFMSGSERRRASETDDQADPAS
jgi:signal peptidase II